MQNLEYARLLDAYASLLTENQQEICKLHFSFDLTLSEIAEQKGVSRQSVSDCVSKTKKQLEEFEQKIGVVSERDKTRAMIEKINLFSEQLSKEERQTLKGILDGII